MKRWVSTWIASLLLCVSVIHSVGAAGPPADGLAQRPADPPVFADLGTHWASDSILWLAERGIVSGSFDSTGRRLVRPDDPVTRGEVVKLVAGLKGLQPIADAPAAFTDSTDHWANGFLAAARQAGIANGYPDGSFRPDGQITRAELAAFIERAFAPTGQGGDSRFPDVPPAHWAQPAIGMAAHQNWIRGFHDGSFKPAQQATRAEAFTVLARVDEQQALTNTIRSVAHRQFEGSTKGYTQRALTALQPLTSKISPAKLTALEHELGPAWIDGDRIPSHGVLQQQSALISDVVSIWNSGKLRRPGYVNGLGDLLMAVRQGAELAVTDIELVLGLSGRVAAKAPSSISALDWSLAGALAKLSRQALGDAEAALARADANAATEAYRRAWETGTKAITLAGVKLTPDANGDLDGDGVPDDLELRFGANPWAVDTDGDGLTDWFEITYDQPPGAEAGHEPLTRRYRRRRSDRQRRSRPEDQPPRC